MFTALLNGIVIVPQLRAMFPEIRSIPLLEAGEMVVDIKNHKPYKSIKDYLTSILKKVFDCELIIVEDEDHKEPKDKRVLFNIFERQCPDPSIEWEEKKRRGWDFIVDIEAQTTFAGFSPYFIERRARKAVVGVKAEFDKITTLGSVDTTLYFTVYKTNQLFAFLIKDIITNYFERLGVKTVVVIPSFDDYSGSFKKWWEVPTGGRKVITR